MGTTNSRLAPAPFGAVANHGLSLPDGYDSFLAYAVARTRKPAFDETTRPFREDYAMAVIAEYGALRTKSGIL